MTAPASLASVTLHPLLAPISARLHELEAKEAAAALITAAQGDTLDGEKNEGKEFVLVVLDSAQVSSYLGYNGGRAAARAVANLVEVVMSDLGKEEKWDSAAFIVHATTSGHRASALELAQGFDDGSLTGSFVFVSSPKHVERKVAALLSLHGLLPSCTRIIASKQYKAIVDAAGPEIVGKAFYLQDDQLGGADSEPPSTEADGEEDGGRGMYDSFGNDGGREGDEGELDAAGEVPLRVNPDLPIQAQVPRICTSFALQSGKCQYGPRCKHSHAYRLSKDEEAALRVRIKAVPCVSVKEPGLEPCPHGESCLYGHVCPQGANCMRGSRCYFQGDACHLGQHGGAAGPNYPTSTWFRGGGRGGRGRGGYDGGYRGGRAFSGNYGGAVRGRGRGRGMERGNSWEGRALGEPEWADGGASPRAERGGEDGARW